MPTVNHPLEGTQTNATSISVAIPRFFVAVVAFLLALLLRQALRSRRDKPPPVQLASPGSPGSIGWQDWAGGLSEKSRGVSNTPVLAGMSANHESKAVQPETDRASRTAVITGGLQWSRDDTAGIEHDTSGTQGRVNPSEQYIKMRPPPPLPMTPPESSTAAFPFEERRFSSAASTFGELGPPEFLDQSSHDYAAQHATSSASVAALQQALPIPRRKSYAKVLPLGPPEPVAVLDHDSSASSVAPSSFPSSSPTLPLAPHDSFETRAIDVQGEIISVMDHSGAGWKRHTRVYGGGVCLACMASGGEGGFYGERVRPEERRQ